MADLEKNENFVGAENSDNFEDSTIFSAPQQHNDRKKSKGKKLIRKIIAAVLVVAFLTSTTVAVIKLIPEMKEETIDPTTFEAITVLDNESDDIDTVTLINGQETVNLYSEREDITLENKETGELEVKDQKVTWYVDGIDKELIDSDTVAEFVKDVVNISASREITQKTAEECGLNSPDITLNVTTCAGEKITIYYGDISVDNSGCYMKLADSDKIYLVDTSFKEDVDFTVFDFASTAPMACFEAKENDDYFSEGELIFCDKITITGNNFPKPVIIVGNGGLVEQTKYVGYIVTSPSTRIAQNTEAFIELFKSGAIISGVYAYDTSPASIKATGLDNPDFVVTMEVLGESITYKYKLQSDGNYAAYCDKSRVIGRVQAALVESFINSKTTDYYASWVCLNSINDLSNFTIKTADKTYSFDISTEVEDDATSYHISHNGEDIVARSFQNLYQYCISIYCVDFNIDKVVGNPDVVFEFTFTDGGKSVVEFTKFSETRYQYSIDGIDTGKVTATNINTVLKYVEKLSQGETIGEIN